jgi:hypothetical protein
VSSPYLSSATEAGGVVQFSVKVQVDRAALSTRFANKNGKGSGH